MDVCVSCNLRLGASCETVPVFHILVVIQILAPFYQIVYFSIEILIIHHREFLVIKRIFVKLFKLLLELCGLDCSDIYVFALLVN